MTTPTYSEARSAFELLQAGQAVSITGKYLAGEGFRAVEISRQAADEGAEIACPVRAFDANTRRLRVFEQDFVLAPEVEVKSADETRNGALTLQAGTMIKLKGEFDERRGFIPRKIKIRETLEFNIEELQGVIAKIERGPRRFYLNGIPVFVTEDTIILAEG